MLETRSTAETGLRWVLETVSYCQESQETGKTDIGRWFNGSRIKHSTRSVGEPRTRSGDEPGRREGPQLTVEAVEQRNVLEMYGRYQSDAA